jgi:hypothetical protein
MSKTDPMDSVRSLVSRITDRVHHAKETFEAGGVDFPGVGPLLWVVRKFGWTGTLLIILLVGFPFGEYSVLRSAVYSAVPRTIGGFGLHLEAEEWDLSPLRLKATARNVRLLASDTDSAVLSAGEVEFQGSAWTFLRGLPDMLTFHIFGGLQPFNEIVVRHGELVLERSLTGKLNMEEFFDNVPPDMQQEALSGVYEIHGIRFEDFRITYIEHIAGGSGDGVIKTAQAQVKVDEINATFNDVTRPEKPGERPTRFRIAGRSADGVFEITGNAALFPPGDAVVPEPPAGMLTSDGNGSDALAFRPFDIAIYLENIAAGALGRMIPINTMVPSEGVLGGTVKLTRVGKQTSCEGDFTARDLRLIPNTQILTDPVYAEDVRLELAKLVPYSGPMGVCDDDAQAAPSPAAPPPASYGMARLSRQATAIASPRIQALAAYDQQSLSGHTPRLTPRELAVSLGEQAAENFAQSLGNRAGLSVPAGAGRTITKGVKGVGSGIKRLFGGKD